MEKSDLGRESIMNISLICFTRDGFETMKRINDTLSGASEAFANASCPEHRDRSAKTEDRSCEGGTLYKSLWIAGRYALQLAATDAGVPYQAVPEGGLSEWTKEAFLRDDALIFVGACGIAVRSIAPYVRDKFQDPAVVCVDEAGQFVIPLLSGHVGGANRLAEMVASGIGAVPVVTTATDVEKKFAVDMFAKELQVPFLTFSSEELNGQPGDFPESEFVQKTTGTGNVCERSAVAVCRLGVRASECRILIHKEAEDGVTVAAAYYMIGKSGEKCGSGRKIERIE